MAGTVELVLSVVGSTVAVMIPVGLLLWRIVVYFDKRAEKARDGVEKRAEARVAAIVETLARQCTPAGNGGPHAHPHTPHSSRRTADPDAGGYGARARARPVKPNGLD